MKIFNLRGELDDKILTEFTEFSNTYWEEDWMIYIENGGGSNWVQEQISYILKQRESRTTLSVIRAYSSAFRLMLLFNGKINILPGARGMIHQSSREETKLVSGKRQLEGMEGFNRMIDSEDRIGHKRDLELISPVLTEKELNDYKHGLDIFFTDKQLTNIIKKKSK